MSIQVKGKRLDPTVDGPEAKLLPRKMAPGRPQFVLGHLPQRWNFDDMVGEFLPSLSTICFSAGVQGARALRDGADGRKRLDTSAVQAHFRSKDGVIIDPADKRLGEFRGYQQEVQNDALHTINCSIFETWDVIGKEVWWDHETDEYRKFLRLLMAEEIIQPINPRVRRRMIELQERDVKEMQRRYGASPSHEGLRGELEHAVARLRAMRDGIPTADAIALIRAEGRTEATVHVDAPAPKSDARTIDDELAEAREYLAEMKDEYPDVYKSVVGRKRPQVAGLPRVREYIAKIEDAIEVQP